ncbi:MAG: sensor histidine kinase [Lysobacterales bacterium]
MPVQLRRHAVQALIWCGFAALMVFLSRSVGQYSSAAAFIAVAVAAGLWACSEVLRALALRRGWLALTGVELAWRVILAVLALPVLLQALLFLALSAGQVSGLIELPGNRTNYTPGLTFLYWLNSVMPLAIWAAAWVSIQALRRYRLGEIQRLRAEATHSALELDALRARLNPHFIFNALNNLRAMINEDTDRARAMVTQLSNTLRHALDHGQAPSVRLQRELEVVDDYLAIEQVHYEERLQVERDIDAATLGAKLPPMLLQLLVENAIKHGIARTPGGGRLRIRSQLDAGTLRLQVCNPGQINPASRGHGVGLAYLRARLAQGLPGSRFTLEQDGDQVRALLEIRQ